MVDIATVNVTLNAPTQNTVVTMTGPQGTPGVFQQILGTSNEISVAISGSGGSIATLSLPQAIATTSSPTFLGLTVGASGLVLNGTTVPINYINIDDYVTATAGFCCNSFSSVSGSPVITLNASTGAQRFTSSMVGMAVNINNGSSYMTIVTYTSPTQVTLSANVPYSTSQGSLAVFEASRDDTSGIRSAIAAATIQKAGLRASNRPYVVASNVNLQGIQGFEGQSDNLTRFVAKTPSTSQVGNMFTWAQAPLSPVVRNITIQGPSTKTPAYLSSMTIAGGQLTAVVTNSQTMDTNAPITLWGARNAAFNLRWTRFTTTGTPTSTGFTAKATTWDGRLGYASVSNIAIAAGVITVTTSATNTFESAEAVYLNSLTTAVFLNGIKCSVVNTAQGTTSLQLTAPTWFISSVGISGTTATYTGSNIPTGSFAGASVTFAGFTNSGNNGTFVVTSTTSSSITVTNASAVNETPAVSATAQVTSYTSHSDTGTVAYLNDGTYTDTMSAVHAYMGLEMWTHPGQGYTILNHPIIENLTVYNFQGAQINLHQPNYGYADRITCLGSQYNGTGGLWLESAYATTGRYTDPSAFEVRGGSQLYGQCFGLAAQNAAGLTIGMTGNNGSGIAMVFDGCSGLNVIGGDLESQTPLTGQTDLWPGNCIEMVGGAGAKFSGLNLFGGQQSGVGGSSSAAQRFFYAWNGASAFEYSNNTHLGLGGYVQPTNEIYVDSSCSNYYVGQIGLTGTVANVTLLGSNAKSNLFGMETISTTYAGGLSLVASIPATSSQNHSSPVLRINDSYWNGSGSYSGGFTFESVPNSGANPAENLNITHNGSSGGSSLIYQGGAFSVTGTGVGSTSTSFSSPAINATTFTGALVGNASTATLATTATNVVGGAAGSIPYQTGSGVTSMLATGTGVLIGGTTPSYSNAPTLAGTNFTGIPNTALSNNSVTITAGTGLSGGGAVALGSAVTLTNAGVTSITGTSNQVVASASTGGVTLSLPQNIATTSNVQFGGGTFNGYLTLVTTTVATSGSNSSSPTRYIQGQYWNGTTTTVGGFTEQVTYAAGTNPIETYNIIHAGSTGGSTYNFGNNFNISGSGYVSKYNSQATAGVGMPSMLGVASLTAQSANVGFTTMLTAPSSGLYRISVYINVTTAASTSSTMPDVQIRFTDADTNTVVTYQATQGNTGNNVGSQTFSTADFPINAKAGTNIQYAIGQSTPYASVGSTMQFACRLRDEYLG